MKKLIFLFTGMIAATGLFAQPCSELFISEYVEGSRNNKALEIYNPTSGTIDLSKYRTTRWQNGSATHSSQYSDMLSGSILPYDAVVLVLDRRDTTQIGIDTPVVKYLRDKADLFLSADYDVSFSMSFNGDDALSLDKDNGSGTFAPVDIFGKIGERPVNATGGTNPVGGWTDVSPFNNGQGQFWTTRRTLYRKASVQAGVKTNPSQFNPTVQWDTLPQNSYDGLGFHHCSCTPVGTVGFTGHFFQNTFNTFDSTLLIRVMANKVTTVDVVHKGGTATAGTDFQFSSKTLNFNGEVLSYFRVKLLNGGNFSGTRTIELALRNPGAGTNITMDSIYTITLQGTGTSIKKSAEKPSYIIYPNPSGKDGKVYVSAKSGMEEVILFDQLGRVISTTIMKGSDFTGINTSGLSEGIYFIKIRFSNGAETTNKIIIR